MTHQVRLFTPLQIKSVEFSNRIWVSPMCQYSSREGHPTDWHFVHLGSRAIGGAGLVMLEATAVSPEGRISPDDSGIWSDSHIESFKKITTFLELHGTIPAIQIAHAGRKASTSLPWEGDRVLSPSERGWQTVAPSAVPFKEGEPSPREMTKDDIGKVISDFVLAAERSLKAGFKVLELHMAHGYLIHEFLSPIANKRTDEYGGSLDNRIRFALEIAKAVRDKWPDNLPLFARISATDWARGENELEFSTEREESYSSWELSQSIILCQKLKEIGVDLIDCSSGGMLPTVSIPVGPGYQVRFAEAIRKNAEIKTAAVGMITEPIQAEAILVEQQADAIFMAREFLRNPYWPVHAAKVLGAKVKKPAQYARS